MRRDRSFFIVDLNSTNGVLINGEKVTQQELQDGDLIEIGEVRLNFNRT
jgi:pSer/pThr/pTyr-binding forkhead associated (FHA) protein